VSADEFTPRNEENMPIIDCDGPFPTITDEEKYCLTNCATYEQYYHMRVGFEYGKCRFCAIDHARNIKLHGTNAYWYVCENAFPSDTRKVQLLMWPYRHIRNPWDLTREEWLALYDVLKWAETEYDLPGGMLYARFGNNFFSEGTVPHLHFHIWVPSGTGEVRVPIFKDPKARAENAKRAEVFAARYERHEVPHQQ
jgi:diadenosine tetraphosphate (Ap4A) HIT family hydrolase